MSDLKEEEDRSESPVRPKRKPPALRDDPGPSDTKINDKVITGENRHKQHDSEVKLDMKRKMPEDDKKEPISFSPELTADSSYRFRCPGPGVFQCALTRLVFGMTQEAELLYRAVLWDESLLQSAGKTAAGMLFKITCSEDAVCQLHLPHCETKEALLVDGLLSAVHVADDGMSVLEPLEITDTHVVVKVPQLSAFGLVWDAEKRFLNASPPVNGQVLLFLRPPRTSHQVLDVCLLQSNIPVHEVTIQQAGAELIMSSDCHLSFGKSYSVFCEPEDFAIQPERAPFYPKYGPNFHPTFEVFLTANPQKVTLKVQDQERKEVWKRDVYLTGPRREIPQRTTEH